MLRRRRRWSGRKRVGNKQSKSDTLSLLRVCARALSLSLGRERAKESTVEHLKARRRWQQCACRDSAQEQRLGGVHPQPNLLRCAERSLGGRCFHRHF